MKPLASHRILDLFRPSLLCVALAFAWIGGCSGSDGSTGPQGPAGPPGGSGATNTALVQGDDVPGMNVVITGLSGGTAPGGRFQVGDVIKIAYTAKKDDGTDWDVTEFSTARTLVSGPSFNYQRIIAEVQDVATRSVQQADGSYTYTFASPIPATYLAPLNDSASFGAADGELTGTALLDGTYTVGLYFNWTFTVDGADARDAGEVVADFVIGANGAPVAREVVGQDNCNRCHTDLQAHGGRRKSVTLCLLCHTAGAEDKNDAGGTLSPGVSVEFKRMVHRIHSGEHLPSVLGVDTNIVDGSRNYAATPIPLQIIGYGNSVNDFSDIAFPAWPNGLIAMPRDQGYTALAAGAKTQEDKIRTGPSNCIVCHGDPDGVNGPVNAPAQGDLYKAQPSEAACGACHDDVHWGELYTSNGQSMPTSANNSNCTLCHADVGDPLAVADAHTHPLLNRTFNPGLKINVSSLVEAGTNNADGTIDPGEKVSVTFTMTNDAGVDTLPSAVANLSVIVSGPTNNYNLVLSSSLPTAKLTGAQPYMTTLPMPIVLERVGVSTAALESFNTSLFPHWNVSGGATTVQVRTGLPGGGGNSTLSAASTVPQNWVDVASAAGFARDDYIVIDDGVGGFEEYARIQTVQGTRLWFGTLGSSTYPASLRFAHNSGATVKEVTLATKTAVTDYTLTPATGAIAEVTEFGNGNVVLCGYTTDFVMPAVYPPTLNDSGDLGETTGKWAGKTIVDGTYSLGLWSSLTLPLNLFGESNSYRSASNVLLTDFNVGSATAIEPYDKISSGDNCYKCHQDVEFHGAGRRSFDACVVCHAAAGAEDRPQLVAANAPATTGVTINFRTMLHKIHMGEELANAATYQVVGYGAGAYPNNFGVSTFADVVFPALPGGVRNCTKCHGATNDAWKQPVERDHPTQQGTPVARWAMVCGACHDGTDAQAHIQVQTTGGGAESCGVCHGTGGEWSVERVHKAY